ncbi:uncharacterized protein METZ01_LOCUS464684 [marine metagenome]|uniref:Uncharacterized protein n=1 Tax=marine metagenome TaxID=408172 RepID=A0A383AWB9_9ZZZZ
MAEHKYLFSVGNKNPGMCGASVT